ncbi:N-acetyltransferase [Tatumella sp. TA1]|nr:N-acetyltransferase [Tatumella sp. TA1]
MSQWESERMVYRPLTQEDWPFFLALHQDAGVMQFIHDPHPPEYIDHHYFQPRLAEWHKTSRHWLCKVMCLKSDGTPVGLTGLINRGENLAEVGFLLAGDAQGRGLGSESLNALVNHAFTLLGYRKLTAAVTAGNQVSRKTLCSVGFRQEGTLRESYFLHQRWHDDWIFGLLAKEFTATE